MTKKEQEKSTVDIVVSCNCKSHTVELVITCSCLIGVSFCCKLHLQVGKNFKPIKNIQVDVPGLHYYTLFPKDVGLTVMINIFWCVRTILLSSVAYVSRIWPCGRCCCYWNQEDGHYKIIDSGERVCNVLPIEY